MTRARWEAARREVFRRAGPKPRCASCGVPPPLEVDHIRPVEHGGALYALENLQLLCRSCHIDKHVPDPERRRWIQLVRS